MSMKSRPFFHTICVIFFISSSINFVVAKVIRGNNKQGSDVTFDFSIGTTLSGSRFFLGANKPGAGRHALSVLDANKNEFVGLTPEASTVNGEKGEKNPLFDACIKHIGLLGSGMGTIGNIMYRPVVSLLDDPGLYLIFDNNRKTSKVITLDALKDSEGQRTAGVVGLASGTSNFVCAAVKGHEQEKFGEGASGIAIAVLTEDIPAGDYRKREMLIQTDGQHKAFLGSCASPFTNKSPMVRFKTGGDPTILDDAIDLHWDDLLQRLFVCYKVKTSDESESGAWAVAVGMPQNGRMLYTSIASEELFDGAQDKIVGVKGPNAQAVVHQVETLHFNGWSQLIVLGSSGVELNSKRSVFALPIVNGGGAHTIGTLASIDAQLEETQHPRTRGKTRAIAKAATNVEQIYTSSSTEAQVGGGPLSVGDIDKIFVHNSAVYALVSSADEGQQPGLFVSCALLKENGMVSGWTEWKRVGGVVQGAQAVNIDVSRAAYTCVSEKNESTLVTRTTWKNSETGQFSELLKEINEGSGSELESNSIECVIAVGPSNKSIQNTSLIICTGTNRVIMAENARISEDGELRVCKKFSESKRYYDTGTVIDEPEQDTTFIEFTGGQLEELGPIVSADIASDIYGQNGWLFVGGVKGLAVLAYPNGSGWNPRNNELGHGFTGLRFGMQFMPVGEYRFIRKLFHDSGFLYVLTDKYLDRIDLSRANFAARDVSDIVVRVASVESDEQFESCSVFYDCLISEKLCLLATNNGLFRVENGQNIQQASADGDIDWRLIPTSKILAPIQLTTVSATGEPQDVARDPRGGIVYALCSDRGFNRSCCYRLTIKSTVGSNVITDDTVVSQLAFRFKDARNYCATDGSCLITARNKNMPYPCSLFGRNQYRKDTALDFDTEATKISSIVQCKLTGTWFIGGDFGLKVNE